VYLSLGEGMCISCIFGREVLYWYWTGYTKRKEEMPDCGWQIWSG
jgi:hypothetical protein